MQSDHIDGVGWGGGKHCKGGEGAKGHEGKVK